MDISLTGVKRPLAPSTHDDLAARDTKRPRVEPGSETAPPHETLRDQERTQLLRTCRHELPEAAWNHLSAAIDKAIDPAHASGTLDLSQCDPDACAALPLRVANSIYDHLKAYGCPLRRVVLPAAIESLPLALGHLNDLNRAGRARIVFQGCPVLLRKAARELLIAIRKGDIEATRAALLAGAPVNTTDEHGKSALMHAAMRGDLATINLLIDSGANVHQRIEDTCAMSRAVSPKTLTAGSAFAAAAVAGRVDAMHALLDAGANINEMIQTPALHGQRTSVAAFFCNPEFCNAQGLAVRNALISRGAWIRSSEVYVLPPGDSLKPLIDQLKRHDWAPTDAEWKQLEKAINTPLSPCIAMPKLLEATERAREFQREIVSYDVVKRLHADLKEIETNPRLYESLRNQAPCFDTLIEHARAVEAHPEMLANASHDLLGHFHSLIVEMEKSTFSLLGFAATHGNVRMVRQLVARGANPCRAWIGGQTALTMAVNRGNFEMAQLLLQLGVPVSQSVTPWGHQPIYSLSDNVAMANLLLDAGANPNAYLRVEGNKASFPLVARRLSPEVLAVLLNRGATDKLPMSDGTALFNLAKVCATKDGKPEDLAKAELLLARIADPDAVTQQLGISIPSIPGFATTHALVKIVATLIEKGADPVLLENWWRDREAPSIVHAYAQKAEKAQENEKEAKRSEGTKAAQAEQATRAAKAAMADKQTLEELTKGACIRPGPMTPRQAAAGVPTLLSLTLDSVVTQTMRPLLNQLPEDKLFMEATPGMGRFAPDDETFTQSGLALRLKREALDCLVRGSTETFMTRAAKAGDLPGIKQMLALGADIHLVNSAGESPLMAAVRMQQREVVDHLLACGARPNQSKLPDGQPPQWAMLMGPRCLDVAISYGGVEMIKTLLAGAGQHAPARVKSHHINAAIDTGNLQTLELLLAHFSGTSFASYSYANNQNSRGAATLIANRMIENEPPVLVM